MGGAVARVAHRIPHPPFDAHRAAPRNGDARAVGERAVDPEMPASGALQLARLVGETGEIQREIAAF